MTQFTANEVRDAITWKYGDKLTRISAMLDAYADRLEADERAVPVYQHRNKNGPLIRWFDCTAETYELMERNEHDRDHFDRRILYTHPTPADAERLVQALRLCMDAMLEKGVPTHPDADARVAYTAAEEALAAHSAQAQPPAASVTDAMVNAAMRADFCGHNVADALMCGTDWNTEVMRAALEAALAAQENPNG